MKSPYSEITLEVGGAHYPEVGGLLLEKFGNRLVLDVCQKINQCRYLSDTMKILLINDIKCSYSVQHQTDKSTIKETNAN
jgi:hypothetical protein